MTPRPQQAARFAPTESRHSAPSYESRVRRLAAALAVYEVWQLPAASTPQITAPTRVAGLKGRNLELVEHRVLRRLSQAGINLARPADQPMPGLALSEDRALHLGLMFRALAPMRSRERMRAVAKGIERMDREEAAYWLGTAMHRRRPRRVLAASRMLLTAPTQ